MRPQGQQGDDEATTWGNSRWGGHNKIKHKKQKKQEKNKRGKKKVQKVKTKEKYIKGIKN